MGATFLPIPKPGDTLIFKGCVFNDGWEFDAPAVLYSPVGRFDSVGSLCAESLYGMIESVCIDLVIGEKVRDWFSESELHEFKWRGWNANRFKYRKRAIHGEFKAEFFGDSDDLQFTITQIP